MKWISSYSPMGRRRTPERVMIFAIANAIAEGLPFSTIGTYGKHTYNFKD